MGKRLKLLIIGCLFALCACFSFGTILVSQNNVDAVGISVENGANVEISGGLIVNNNKAIVIEGGEHVIENVTISGSTNGGIHLAGGR